MKKITAKLVVPEPTGVELTLQLSIEEARILKLLFGHLSRNETSHITKQVVPMAFHTQVTNGIYVALISAGVS